MVADAVLSELKDFGKALNREDRLVYERLLKLPLKHLGSIGFASSLHVWAFLLLSMIMEQDKKLDDLKKMLDKRLDYEGLADRRVPEHEQDSAVDEDS